MSEFNEENLRFTFDDKIWAVVKYDEHRDYRERIEKVDGTRAVDFVGLQKNGETVLYWIEVKDFRGHRIENKMRLTSGELALEVATKVRDSLAGVIGAYCSSSRRKQWREFVRCIWRRPEEIRVLVWLEEDPMPRAEARRKNDAQMRARLLKEKLSWLTHRVLVVNQQVGGCPAGLVVSNLPGAGQS